MKRAPRSNVGRGLGAEVGQPVGALVHVVPPVSYLRYPHEIAENHTMPCTLLAIDHNRSREIAPRSDQEARSRQIAPKSHPNRTQNRARRLHGRVGRGQDGCACATKNDERDCLLKIDHTWTCPDKNHQEYDRESCAALLLLGGGKFI